MNLISVLLRQSDHSSPGSRATAEKVFSMLTGIKPEKALFIGDDFYTPELLAKNYGSCLTAAFTEAFRVERGIAAGLNAVELCQCFMPESDNDCDLIWYNGFSEPESCVQRLEQLRSRLRKGGVLVYRAVCWLTEPSLDTKKFCQQRFGEMLPLDKILVLAKEHGWRVQDFYIAPKADWYAGYYSLLTEAAEKYAELHQEDSGVYAGINELHSEAAIFDAHCEEYSCVYYILKG